MPVYKKMLVRASILLVSLLLFLTFFSNTIYTFNLPGVTLDYPKEGVIKNEATGEGIIEFAESKFFYASENGRIELLVQVGNSVSKGSPMYMIEADVMDLQKSVENALQEIDRINISISKTQSDIDYNLGLLENLTIDKKGGNLSANAEILGYEQEIERLNIAFEQKSGELQKIEILFNAGAVPKADLAEKQNEIAALKNQISQIEDKKQYAVTIQAENASVAKLSSEKDFEERRMALNKTLKDLDFQLQEFILQKKKQEEIAETLDKQMKFGGKQTIYADVNGIVTKIAVDMEQSDYISKNALVVKIGLMDAALQTIVSFREGVDYLNVNDTVTINVKIRQQYNLIGTVKQLFFEDGLIKAKIEFTAPDNISGGETAEVHIEHVSESYKNILPNAAIRKDAQGYYILYAQRVKSSFGYEFYARRITIHVQMQDIRNTAFTIVSDESLPVIINSDKPVSENDRIQIVGGSDLIGIR